jgi:hypothetical protein
MQLPLAPRTLPSLLFVVAGIFLAVASFFATESTTPGIDVSLGTSLVIHLHPLRLGVFLCFLYATLYYIGARVLHLDVPITLASLHLLITFLAVIGLRNLHYFGSAGKPIVINPVITILAQNALMLLMLSGLLLVANVLLASLLKWRLAH